MIEVGCRVVVDYFSWWNYNIAILDYDKIENRSVGE